MSADHITGAVLVCLVSFSRQPSYSALNKLDSAARPSWAYIVITDRCSHKCGWCYGGFNHDLSVSMSVEDFTTILSKLKEINIEQITLAGGEPTEHPNFRQFAQIACDFGYTVHVASHGQHIDRNLAEHMSDIGVSQVQINWQGRRFHDAVHGVPGSYGAAADALRDLNLAGVETTATITVGKYNLGHVGEIMSEAAALGVTRLRVWEATGVGRPFLRDVEASDIFAICADEARRLGFIHCLSYDPVFEGNITVPCIQYSALYMYINARGILTFCGAVPGAADIADCLSPDHSGHSIKQAYLAENERIFGDSGAYCVARGKRPSAVPVEIHLRG